MKKYGMLILLALLAGATQTALAEQQSWRFQVFLDDSAVGQHTFRIDNSSGQQILTSEANFLVKFLFINAYRYEHTSIERWQGNCLQQIKAATNDNGTQYAVTGQRQQNGFAVKVSGQEQKLPGCVMTFAYWNPEFLQQQQLLNSQTGEYISVSIRFVGEETYTTGEYNIPAKRYELQAEELKISLWYTVGQQQWLGLESTTEDNHKLRYQLMADEQLSASGQLLASPALVQR